MRPLLLPGLLDAAAHNAAHGRDELALFESARAFRPSGPLDDCPGGLARRAPRRPRSAITSPALLTVGQAGGLAHAGQGCRLLLRPGAGRRAARDGRRGLARRARRAAVPASRAARPRSRPSDGAELGFIGELHPEVAAAWELEGPVAAFELDLDALGGSRAPTSTAT